MDMNATSTALSTAAIGLVFLTGGTGFLGSHLRALLADRVEVTLPVRPGSSVSPRSTESVVRGDVTDPETLSVKGHSTVVHLAARTSVADLGRRWLQ
ncbi:hypothetical protein BRC86_07890 [Halobacteriales archaeon QS_3_64_16]|nr:MAG: hypothetical protein BRC86_07890 [Halobacteriales archaeon QS_3_64_16]